MAALLPAEMLGQTSVRSLAQVMQKSARRNQDEEQGWRGARTRMATSAAGSG